MQADLLHQVLAAAGGDGLVLVQALARAKASTLIGWSAVRAVRDKALDWCGRRRLGSLAQEGEGRFRLWQQMVPGIDFV
ncbi:hypothetical protein [Chelatococcus composti]|uniref:Uncharacterized protein n=1 Tax=Chelatococcus composti TaxID=1743235 RepID=A0A841KII2_9HYPH|nr:hypothetical protein [Chelatococcus composti]MBB6169203.1 hypothetical protein [Chelatococcus composti]MBS7735915.1 hypothetical protein [Chelatococcus composti]